MRFHVDARRPRSTSEILHVVGNLEVAGIAEPLEFAVTVQPAGDGLAVEATTTVDQRRFGMSSGLLGMIRRPATLHVEALLKRDADGRHHD